MENKLIMVSDVIIALVDLIAKNGDCPIAIADQDSKNAMVPVDNIHMVKIHEKNKGDNKGENLVIIANFTLTDNDGESLGYFK